MARLFIGGLPPGGVEVLVDDLESLEWSSVVPGGDDRCTFEMTCAKASVAFPSGLPLQLEEVRVTGAETMDILWIGWLRKPVIVTEDDVFVSVDFEAEGYQYSGLVEPFEDHVKYGPASVGSSSLDKVVTTSVTDAMSHARSQKTPAITGERFFAAPNFDEDTESFYGKAPPDVWTTANNIIGYFANPLYWQVYAIDGEPTLELFPHGGLPDYFEDGKAKSKRLEFDAADVVWRVVASFGGTQNYVASAAPAISTPYTKSKVLNLETEAKSLTQVTQVADAAVARLNVVRITGGSVVIDKPIRGRYCVDDVLPEYLRAGRMIDVVVPVEAAPYHTDQIDVGGTISGFLYVKRCMYNAKTCEATLSPSAYTDEAKALRMLPFQNSPALTWGIAFGTFGGAPRLDKLYPEGTSTIPTRGDPTSVDNPIIGSMIPTSYKTDSLHDYGPTGGVIDPRDTPKEAVTANYMIIGPVISTSPLDYGTIKDEEAAVFQAIPEMVVERVMLLSPNGISGTITLNFHRFVRSTLLIEPDVIPAITLTSGTYQETVIASPDPDPGDPDTRTTFRSGDWIIIDVEGDAVALTKLGIGIFGRKIWESIMPLKATPAWVQRPGSPSYPHNAMW